MWAALVVCYCVGCLVGAACCEFGTVAVVGLLVNCCICVMFSFCLGLVGGLSLIVLVDVVLGVWFALRAVVVEFYD